MGATQSIEQPHILETKIGKLKGLQQSDQTGKAILHRYTKVPYALPPIGDLRWRRPQKLPSDFNFDSRTGEPGDYTAFGPICPQPVYNHSAAVIENPEGAPAIDNIQSEDCLYLNIWVPAGQAPPQGWPVQFHIHGGWLQVGNANQTNDHDPYSLLAHSAPRIIVAPTYRLNIFGFLAGSDLASETADSAAGNYGLWDQRCALEWTHEHISLFGGDPSRITVGGLSAGSHSAFLQLYYDTTLPERERIIGQVYLWSNAMAIQPNATTSEVLTSQFDSLCTALDISTTQPGSSKISALRSTPAAELISAIPRLAYHTFRSSTDDSFIPSSFLRSLHDGTFATRLARSDIRLLLGEVHDEALLYKLVNPPSDHAGLTTQLGNYYPAPVVRKLLSLTELYDIPTRAAGDETTRSGEAYADVFARMVADLQVHASLRGLTHVLRHPPPSPTTRPLPAQNLFRYHIAWRATGLDAWLDPAVGVCHAADTPIWWASGYRAGFTAEDKEKAESFLKPFGQFLNGEKVVGWGSGGEDEKLMRILDEDGVVREAAKDEWWERGLAVWDAVWEAQRDMVTS